MDVGTWERKSLTGKGHILDDDDSPSFFLKKGKSMSKII